MTHVPNSPDNTILPASPLLSLAELTEDESGRATAIMISYLRRLENVYFQHKEGLVDDSALNAYGMGASFYFESREFEEFWSERRADFDPGFADFFEGRLAVSDG